MIQFFNPSAQMFLSGMNAIQNRLARAQQQLTTGLKINSVSDNPDVLGNLMQVRSSLAQTQQLNTNLGRVKTETDTAEGSLQSAVSLLDNIATLASEGEPTTMSAATRTQLAGQVGSDLQQMVGLANTSVENRFVFSGDTDQTQPYTVDVTQTSAVSAYQGSDSTRQVQSPDGSTFALSLTAHQIFDSSDPTTSVFGAINGLRNALLNNDQTAIDTSIATIQTTATYLNTQLAFYGTVQDRVASATNFGANLTTELLTEQSGIQDADMTQAITDMTQASTQQQAALLSEKQIPRTSLFDYLG